MLDEALLQSVRMPAAASREGARRHGKRHRANDALALALFLIVAVAPIPFGSARPFFWASTAVFVAGTGALYFLVTLGREITFRPAPLASVALFALLCAYLGLQMVALAPLAGLAPVITRAGAVIATHAISIDAGATWLMLLRFLTYGLVALLFWQVAASRERTKMLLEAFFFLIAVYALYGLVALTELGDTILIMPKWAYLGAATGTFVNRNSFATFLAFGAVTGTGLVMHDIWTLIESRERGSRKALTASLVPHLVGISVIFVSLLATQSRMGLFAGAAGGFVVLLLGLSKLPRQRTLMVGTSLAALAAGAVFFFLYGGGLTERLGSLQDSIDVRWNFYRQIWQMILARPLLGYGGGTFEEAYPLYHALPVSPDLVWEKAHNSYLALWSELGFIAGSIPLLLLAFAAWRALRNWYREVADWAPAIIAIGVAVTGAVHSLVDFSLEIEGVTLMFLALLCLGSGISPRAR